MYLIFLDTETTGRDPEKHRILEIAFQVYNWASFKPVLSYEATLSQPAEVFAEADPESLAYNGFTWEKTIKGKTEKAIEAEIFYDLNQLNLRENSGAFVCQNPAFDYAFFCQLIHPDVQRGCGWPYHWLDLASMYFAIKAKEGRDFAKGVREKDLSKNAIAETLGLPPEEMPHRAMRGVQHLVDCFKYLIVNSIK